jgi:hypothetical protein
MPQRVGVTAGAAGIVRGVQRSRSKRTWAAGGSRVVQLCIRSIGS